MINPDGSEDGKSPAIGDGDAPGQEAGFSPRDVACRIFGADAGRIAGGENFRTLTIAERRNLAKVEREQIATAGLLPQVAALGSVDARGTEHSVRFRGAYVEKHQRSNGWIPVVSVEGKISVAEALPREYLHRLDLQNELFGDDIRILGMTSSDRFAITQPTLKGGEPSEMEIREVLEGAGWERIPIGLQDLPPVLMGSAWWHREEESVLLDARKPNFKKTALAILPIDLILSDLTGEMAMLLGGRNTAP